MGQSQDSTPFKFPFTDNEETDLNLTKNFHVLPEIRNRSSIVGSSSDLVMELSPIARKRDSDASIISCMIPIEGEMLVVDSIGSINNNTENEMAGESQLESINYENNHRRDGKETISEENIDFLGMSPSSNHSLSPTTDSLESAMKQVGQHSSNFIHKIRDAAQKRKVEVTRSRDSLVAKEQEQLRSIAECNTLFAALEKKLQTVGEKDKGAEKENDSRHFQKFESSFKYFQRNNRGNKGFGGVGVPKVEKRPTTTPLSPKLGLRRKGHESVSKASENPKLLSERGSTITTNSKSHDRMRLKDKSARKVATSGQRCQSIIINMAKTVEKNGKTSTLRSSEEKASIGGPSVFKARPAPSSTTGRWNAGQMGIPKVSKRALTVPVSPCLGPKRQPRVIVEYPKPKVKTDSSGSSSELSTFSRRIMSPSSVRNSPLLGLTLINSNRKERHTIIESLDNNTMQQRIKFKPFVPRSTTRASMRKQYNVSRVEKRALSLLEKRERLRSQIEVIHQELKILSKDLT